MVKAKYFLRLVTNMHEVRQFTVLQNKSVWIIVLSLLLINGILMIDSNLSKNPKTLDGEPQSFESTISLDVNNQWDTMLNIRDMEVSDSGDIFVVGTIKARSYDYHFSSIGTIYIPGDGYEAFAGKMNSIGEWDWILLAPDHQTTSFFSIDVHDSLGVFIAGLSQTGSGSSFMFDIYTSGGEMTPSNPVSTTAATTIDPSQMILWVTDGGVINNQWYGGGESPTIGSIRDIIVDGSELHAVGMLGPSSTMYGSSGWGDASMQNSHTSHMGVMARFSIAENQIDMKWSDMLCDSSSTSQQCRGQFIVQKLAMDETDGDLVMSGWFAGTVNFYDSSETLIQFVPQGGFASGFLATYESDVGVKKATSVSTDNSDAIYAISYNDGNIAVSAKLGGSDIILAPNMEGSAVIIYDDTTLSSNTSSIHRYTVSNSSEGYVEFFDVHFLSSGNVLVASKVYSEVQVGSSSYDLDQNPAILVSELDSQGNWINSVQFNVEVDNDSTSLSHQLSIDSNDQFVIHIEAIDDLHVFTRMTMDIDSDGISDSDDNCPNLSNPSQTDSDSDSQGDACDLDDDGDGIDDGMDDCHLTFGVLEFVGCPIPEISGCTDPIANNFNPSATNSTECDYDLDNDGVNDTADACMSVPGNQTDGCPPPPLQEQNSGCIYEDATNFMPNASADDGSCQFETTVIESDSASNSPVMGFIGVLIGLFIYHIIIQVSLRASKGDN